MRKRARQNILLKLVEKGVFTSQAELADRLTASGFSVTQASVSRDLEELGIVKSGGIYVLPRRVASDLGEVTFDTAGGCLIVGRCLSGLASAVTVKIDSASVEGVVGTIAGDDTIFIAVKEDRAQASVLQSLRSLFI